MNLLDEVASMAADLEDSVMRGENYYGSKKSR